MIEQTGVESLIGNTPLYEMTSFDFGSNVVYVKMEMFNPGGSVKDRVAYNMIKQAEESGFLKQGMRIVEPTSGNTGIGLAMIGAARGYEVTIIMPESVTKERISIVKRYGAEVILTPKKTGIKGAIKKAAAIKGGSNDIFIPDQFKNPANPAIHRLTTGPEIKNAINGNIDYFVAGIGTGGTITGAGGYLKKQFPELKLIGVEPRKSAVISGEKPGKHAIQGIGAGFIPDTLDRSLLDSVMSISDEDAYQTTDQLATKEGLFVGPSSGAALSAVLQLIQEESLQGKTIVTLFPDGGLKYLSLE